MTALAFSTLFCLSSLSVASTAGVAPVVEAKPSVTNRDSAWGCGGAC